MWKTRLPSGRIQYNERYKDPLTGRRRKITITLDKGRRSDDQMAAEIIRRKIREELSGSKPEMVTFAELIRRYEEYLKSSVKPQTLQCRSYRLATICRLIGSDTLTASITAPYISASLSSDSPAATTYNERLRAIKMLLRWGYQSDLISDIAYIEKLQRRKELSVREKDQDKYLDHDEITAVLNAMQQTKWKLLTEFLILSGLRIGEAIALNTADVDLDAGVIHVTKTFSLITRKISSTKTDASCRDVYMQDQLKTVCHDIRRFILHEQLEYAYRSNLFIPDVNTGEYLHYGSYRKYLIETTTKAIHRPLTPHALRHTHVAMLAESGVALDTIMRRVGHTNSKVTKEVYMHVTEKMKEQDRAAIQNLSII